MRITIVGNCQARPLAELVTTLRPDVTVPSIQIVHLLKAADEEAFERAAVECDVVFSQQVAANYPVSYVRSAAILGRFGTKVKFWPNLFFKGQCPDLCYVTGQSGERIVSPMAEYHSRLVLESWRAGVTVAEALAALMSDIAPGASWTDIATRSLHELREREKACDVSITDHIAQNWRQRRLFFTFNHPTSELMLRVAADLLRLVDLPPELELTGDHVGEPLNRLLGPTWPGVARELGLVFPTSPTTRGVPVETNSLGIKLGTAPKIYAPLEMITASYRCYDAQAAKLENCRIT